jgi:hypothetical protein
LFGGASGRLTATSTDGACGGRIVGVVVLAAEGIAESVDGLALEADPDVGVDAGVGVPQHFLDHDEVNALFQQQGPG